MEGNNSNLSDLTVEERNLLAVLAQHVSSDDPITSREIRAELHKDDREGRPEVRALVRTVMQKTGVPIGASNRGYFIIADEKDLNAYLARLEETIYGTMERYNQTFEAFHFGEVLDFDEAMEAIEAL